MDPAWAQAAFLAAPLTMVKANYVNSVKTPNLQKQIHVWKRNNAATTLYTNMNADSRHEVPCKLERPIRLNKRFPVGTIKWTRHHQPIWWAEEETDIEKHFPAICMNGEPRTIFAV